MAYSSYIEIWESDFDNIVSENDKVQYSNIIQFKVEVHITYEKDEKITTDFELTDDSDVIKRTQLDEKLSGINGHLYILEKDHKEFLIIYYKQSVETSIQRAVKTTIPILYDKGLFENSPNADGVLKSFIFITRRRVVLENVNDDVIQ